MSKKFAALENTLAALALLAIVVLPLVELLSRPTLGTGIAGSIDFVRHLTLWIAFLGALLASRENRHLSLGSAVVLPGRLREFAAAIARSAAGSVCLCLAWASLDMVLVERDSELTLGTGLPLWVAQLIMPIGFLLNAGRFLLDAMRLRYGRYVVPGTLVSLAGLALLPEAGRDLVLVPGLLAITVFALAGTPIFALLGGAAILLYYVDAIPLAAISVEAYRMAANPILPTIPLFTLAGTVLATGQASVRLLNLFRGLFGWLPGGSAIAGIVVCAFFTTFTGGSGVTILALGGLLLPLLVREGYTQHLTLGSLTASGSLGILFPPSLLIILYGVASHTPINQLFAAGILPGLLLLVMIAVYTVIRGGKNRIARQAFDSRRALRAMWVAKWEILLPVGVLFGIFSGFATMVEIAALAACYTLLVEFCIHRDLSLLRDLPTMLKACAVMVGGVMIILATAMGLTSYLIYADIPQLASEWIQTVTQSPWVFLLALNGFLLLAGCLLDIFSAIVVVVPLILPAAAAFGIDPVHLGIIFLANMELGYLTPPVGMNLASFRFEKPLATICRATLPFFVLNLIAVLIITFCPWFTTLLPDLLGL